MFDSVSFQSSFYKIIIKTNYNVKSIKNLSMSWQEEQSCFTQNKTKEKPQKTIQNFTDSLKTLKPAKIYVTLIKDVYLF